ncbi:MAG: VOC family protein [Gammaproteobacteria bacterium]|nr:VOC family protein [Gammaproteobacteria bacterium]
MSDQQPEFLGLYLFVKDLPKTLNFYELLGLEIENVSEVFARASWSNGIALEFGTSELTESYDPGWKPPGLPSTNTINFQLSSRAAVDETYNKMIAAGFVGHLAPCDPLWQARFAIILDPNGNFVGLHSPRDRDADRQRERGAQS